MSALSAILLDLIRLMANAIVTLRIMPDGVETDFEHIQTQANQILDSVVGAGDRKAEIEPVAFGLKSLRLTFVMDESRGSPDPIAEKMLEIAGVQSSEVVDVRRAVG